jgi:hypothetical protein
VEINTKLHLIFQALAMSDLNGPNVISIPDKNVSIMLIGGADVITCDGRTDR